MWNTLDSSTTLPSPPQLTTPSLLSLPITDLVFAAAGSPHPIVSPLSLSSPPPTPPSSSSSLSATKFSYFFTLIFVFINANSFLFFSMFFFYIIVFMLLSFIFIVLILPSASVIYIHAVFTLHLFDEFISISGIGFKYFIFCGLVIVLFCYSSR